MTSIVRTALAPSYSLSANAELSPAIDAPCHQVDLGAAGLVSYYADKAQGGRPLVLLHSINAAPSAREMRPLFDHYRKTRPVYAPDLPGFGRSERRDINYTPEFYADVITQFMNTVVAEPADIIAFSLSAEFAARAITDKPQHCRSLTLISPSGFSQRNPPSGVASQGIQRFLRLPLLGDGLFKLITSRLSIRHYIGLNFTGKPPADMVDYAHATSHQPGAKYAPFAFLSMKLFTLDADTKLYDPLPVPVLVLYDRDPNISFERLERFRTKANWFLNRISPTLGVPHWERTRDTIAALDKFWEHGA